jgi:hypothetical protein
MGMLSIPFEDYLSRPAVSVSKLKSFAKAPALVHVAKEETAATRMGSLVHCAILEPAELEKRYAVTDLERRGAKAWDAEELAAGGRELVKRADWDDAMRMHDAVWAHPVARELLEGCDTEQSFFWTDDETGLDCKARADAINYRLRVGLDVKTSADASPRKFARQFADMLYGWQDAHYRAGLAANDFIPEAFVFIAIEKAEPFLIGIYEISPQDLRVMTEQVRDTLHRYKKCLDANHWPGYDEAITPILLPNWALMEV